MEDKCFACKYIGRANGCWWCQIQQVAESNGCYFFAEREKPVVTSSSEETVPISIQTSVQSAPGAYYTEGYNRATEKALEILDSMFFEKASISVDDWFRDSPNLFQGREEFKRKMEEK